MTTPAVFSCPKCHGTMRSYERSGIVLEQCEDCRGIFLDHGELERFVDAEGGGWSGRVGAPRPEWRPESELAETASSAGTTVRATPGPDRRTERIAALRDLFGDED